MAGRIRHPKQLAEAHMHARAQADAATDPDVREHFELIAKDCAERLRKEERCLSCGNRLEDKASKERGYGPDCWSRLPAGALRGAFGTTDPHEHEEF